MKSPTGFADGRTEAIVSPSLCNSRRRWSTRLIRERADPDSLQTGARQVATRRAPRNESKPTTGVRAWVVDPSTDSETRPKDRAIEVVHDQVAIVLNDKIGAAVGIQDSAS
jgi:hypothetical protein